MLLISSFAWTQEHFFPIRVDQKWGFVDAKGNLVIQPKYDAVGEFGKYSFTRFSLNGRLGIVQANGTELYLPGGQDIEVLDDSTAAVKKDTLWGIRHIDGPEILPISFHRIIKKPSGLIWVKQGTKKGICDGKGKSVVPVRFEDLQEIRANVFLGEANDSVFYYDNNGRLFIKGRFGSIDHTHWPVVIHNTTANEHRIIHCGTQRQFVGFNSWKVLDSSRFQLFSVDSSWIFNTQSGSRVAVDPNYEINTFCPGFFRFIMFGKTGIMTADGQVIVKPTFDHIKLQNGWFVAYKGRRQGLINGRGVQVLPSQYEFITFHRSGLIILQNDGMLGCAKPSGQLLLKPSFSQLEYDERQLRGYRNGILVFVDFDQEWNIKEEYEFKKVKTIVLDFENPIKPKQDDIDFASLTGENGPAGWFKSPRNKQWGFRRPDSSLRHEPIFTKLNHFTETGLTVATKSKPFSINELFGDTHLQTQYYVLAETKSGNYIIPPKHWYIFPQELGKPEVGYARILRFDGKQQIFLYSKGKTTYKEYRFIDSLLEGRARFATGGYFSGNEDPTDPNNACNKLQFLQFIGLDSMAFPWRRRMRYRKEYVQFKYSKWGYLAEGGNELIPAKFDFAAPFENGTAIVKYNGKWGVIDRSGAFVIKPQYFRVKRLNHKGKDYFEVFKLEPRFGLLDSTGSTAVYPEYRGMENYQHGFLPVKTKSGWAFVDGGHTLICQPEYTEVEHFSFGMAAVKKKGRWGFINTNGDLQVQANYQRVLPFGGSYSWGLYRGKWQLIDINGQSVTSKSFKKPRRFHQGHAWVSKGGKGKLGLIDSAGQFVTKAKYKSAEYYPAAQVSVVERNGKKALINPYGKLITDFEFSAIDSFASEWTHAYAKEGRVLLHRSGRKKNLATEYYEEGPFYFGYSRVKYDGRFGYIDTSGEEVIPCIYSEARHFEEGFTFCKTPKGSTVCFNTTATPVFQVKGWAAAGFHEGKAIVKASGTYFYVDTTGRMLFGQTFQKASPFHQGIARVKSGKRWLPIDAMGQPLTTPKFTKLKDFVGPYMVAKRSGSYGLFDAKGSVVLDVMYDEMQRTDDRYYFVSVYDKVGHFDLESGWVWEPKR